MPRIFNVTIPIAGHAFLEIEADDEESAIEKAFEEVRLDHIEEWEALRQFNQGNICYCPQPWEAEAEDWGPASSDDAAAPTDGAQP